MALMWGAPGILILLIVLLLCAFALATVAFRKAAKHRRESADAITELQKLAHFDPLTGLANRRLFTERLEAALDADEEARRKVALFYLDLDDFKGVNDAHGHAFGDALLVLVAARLGDEIRQGDLVARLGGDEFAVLFQTSAGDGMLIERAHRFLGALREPFEIEGQLHRISASVGVARCTIEHCSADELTRRADLALHAAKAKGRDQFAMFDHAIDARRKERREIEEDLREAIAQGAFFLEYQPVLELRTGAVLAYEALLRWNHPARGAVLPDDFLPIAEETGLIGPLGDWTIAQALSEAAQWEGDFRLAVNLSPSHMRDPKLFDTIERTLGETGMAAERVEFEITENVLMQKYEAALDTMAKLRAMGAGIALDDFGTGYSSLSYLHSFAFERIKIDREFVSEVATSDAARAIIAAIVELARTFGSRTTAEGVETPAQLNALRDLGCDEAQGFLIHRPFPAEAMLRAQSDGRELPEPGEAIASLRRARPVRSGGRAA